MKNKLKYDNYRIEGLPELVWGGKAVHLECPRCGSRNMYYSGTPSDPEEVLGEGVRCRDCGSLTDYYEAFKRRKKSASEAKLALLKTKGSCPLNEAKGFEVNT